MATLTFTENTIAVVSGLQDESTIHELATMRIANIAPVVPAIRSVSALNIAVSRRPSSSSAVTTTPIATESFRDRLCGSVTREPVTAPASLDSVAENGGTRNNISGATFSKIAQEDSHYAPPTIKMADTQHVSIDEKFQHNLAEEGLRWADDPDLPPIPAIESKPKQDAVSQPIQEGFKGLASSRWADKQSDAKGHSQECPNGTRESRLVGNNRSLVDRPMLEHKFKRELSYFGLKNTSSPTSNLGSSRTTSKATPQLSSQSFSQPRHKSNQGRQRNTNQGPKKEHVPLIRCENYIKTPRETPRVNIDMEEFQRDVKQYGLKTLEHSRWADKEEPKDETLCKTPASCIDADNSDWRAGGYGVPGLKMDMEAFRLEVKEHGLKTLQDSRWAK